ncbi:putative hscarg dehydrogenase [Paraphaeosphaeria sporulosa]|uniref:Putative hscarg dehydrogenase n=1 Tax=Paraphaeosphaeria sporulosa TaxID=1460663 RepID=A0A177C877_9PLEO|nr:putative hscarg dehydrogenase [Paraphaeosphaeria sporulosa]OAG02900.1 putative hscarg dehydrogenase [Paraphaeosphaeria sporulosa]
MSKLLAVFGATGHQGSSVIHHVLHDPILSAQYTIRALTRDPTSHAAQRLKAKGVDVISADVLDRASLDRALQGSHAVFAMTPPYSSPSAPRGTSAFAFEVENGKRIADAALAAGVRFFIFSTLPSVREISKGKYTAVAPFDGKAEAEKYIRGMEVDGMNSAFICPGAFMENFAAQGWAKPRREVEGEEEVWTLCRPNSSAFRIPLIAAREDVGKFVGAMLRDPQRFGGRRVCAAQGRYSWAEVAQCLGKSAGVEIRFRQCGWEEWRKMAPAEGMRDFLEEAYRYAEEFGGYFGEGEEEGVKWAVESVRGEGELMGLEKFLETEPF